MNATASDTTGFKKATIQVWAKLSRDGECGPMPAPAFVKGDNAVHRNLIWASGDKPGFGESWTVSHISSGMSYRKFTSLNAAKAFASRVPGLAIPGLDGLKTGEQPEWSKKEKQRLHAAVIGLADICTYQNGGSHHA